MVTFLPASGAVERNRVFPNQLSHSIRRGGYMFLYEPQELPMIWTTASTVPALPTASAAQVDSIAALEAFGNQYIELYQATAQTLFPTPSASHGWLIGGDQVNNESVEFVPGGNLAGNRLGHLVGTGPGSFIKLTVEVTDRSGSDQFIVGWRKQESYAVPTSLLTTGDGVYVDFAGIGFSGTASDLVKTMTDVGNSGSTTVTDTTFAFADTKVHTLETRVSKGGVVTYYINGVITGDTVSYDGLGAALTPQTTATGGAYTFTNALQLIPFIFHRYDSTTPGNVFLRRLEVGQLADIGAGASAYRGGI